MAAARTAKKTSKRTARGGRSAGGQRATSRRKSAPPTRARRSLVASRPGLWRLRDLEPHQVDVLALALIAVGIFLGGVAYGIWDGGSLGRLVMRLLETLVGRLAYLIPVGLVLGGGRVLARDLDVAPATRPLRSGAVCLLLALALAFAAGLLGPGAARSGTLFSSSSVAARGGLLGALEYYLAGHLLSAAGADILALFMLIAGVILLSGATFASVVNGSRRHATGLRAGSAIFSATRRAEIRAARLRQTHLQADGPLVVPEPDAHEVIVRATHVEAPAIDVYEDERGQRSFAVSDGEGTAGQDLTPDDPAEFEDFVRLGGGPRSAGGTGGAAAGGRATTTAYEPGDDEQAAAGPGREVDPSELTPQGRYRTSVTDDPGFVWRVPPPRFLVRSTGEAARPDTTGQAQTAKALVEALGHFGIEAKVVGQVSGPHITRYEIRLAPGTKMSKVAGLKDDLAYALAAIDIRILAPIPGKTAVGIEVPNQRRRIVHLGDVFQEPPADWSPLTVWLGKDIGGRAIGADLAKMPHLLVAGTTGAGKSACVNAMLSSVLLRATPHQVRLVLVDPKQVELNHYESIPHLLTPVITNPKMAANALQNLVREMEQRYATMSLARTRSLPELNRVLEGRGQQALPYILCVIDELADLMMVAPADVEDSVIRLAQKARAVGIHLVLATQSPRVDVITGMIKANVPSRIAFAVSSQTDSRVILDQNGAETLLGQGDMLFSPVGTNKLQRIQGAYIDEEQIAELTEAWRRQGEPELREELLEEVDDPGDSGGSGSDEGFDPDEDPLLQEAISLVATMGTASTSMLQRRLRLGYTRAGRLIDMLERRGIISGYEGSKPRQVLVSEADLPRILAALADGGGAGSAGAAAGTAGTPGSGDLFSEPPLEHESYQDLS